MTYLPMNIVCKHLAATALEAEAGYSFDLASQTKLSDNNNDDINIKSNNILFVPHTVDAVSDAKFASVFLYANTISSHTLLPSLL